MYTNTAIKINISSARKNIAFRKRSRSGCWAAGFMDRKVKFFFGYSVLTRLYYITLKKKHASWWFYQDIVSDQPVQLPAGYICLPGRKNLGLGLEIRPSTKNRITHISRVFCRRHLFIYGCNYFYHPLSYAISGMGVEFVSDFSVHQIVFYHRAPVG